MEEQTKIQKEQSDFQSELASIQQEPLVEKGPVDIEGDSISAHLYNAGNGLATDLRFKTALGIFGDSGFVGKSSEIDLQRSMRLEHQDGQVEFLDFENNLPPEDHAGFVAQAIIRYQTPDGEVREKRFSDAIDEFRESEVERIEFTSYIEYSGTLSDSESFVVTSGIADPSNIRVFSDACTGW